MFCLSCGKKISKISKFCKYCGSSQIIKKKLNKKEYEAVWTCDYCGKEFKTKDKSDEHELTCKKDKDKDTLFITEFPNREAVVFLASMFLGIYLFTFAVVNSYAKTNGLEKKYLTNPLNWFLPESKDKIISTPTITIAPPPKLTPTSNPKLTTQTNNTNNNQIECIGPDGKHFNTSMSECEKLNKSWGHNTDYLVNCNVSSNCGGGTKYIRKSECDNSVCCQIGSNWILYTSKQKCSSDQTNQYKGNYTYPTLIPFSTMKPLPTYSYQVPQSYASPTMTDAQAQSLIDQHNSQVSLCRGQVVSKFAGLIQSCNQYGGSSAAEACRSIYEKQRQAEYNSCGQTY
jgi:hypothetical protein